MPAPITHYVCCKEPTAALCGRPANHVAADDDATCVVCVDLHGNIKFCPIAKRCDGGKS